MRIVDPALTVVQDPPLGTGDAVREALGALAGRLAPQGDIGDVLVLFGDTPLLRSETISSLLDERRRTGASIVVAALRPADPGAYGRLVVSPEGELEHIVEAADASPDELAIGLVNGGIMAIEARHLRRPSRRARPRQREGRILPDRYRSDRPAPGARAAATIELPAEELIGINTRAELAAAEALMQQRLRRARDGRRASPWWRRRRSSSAPTPDSVRDVVVEPNVVFGPGVSVGERARIRAFSHLEGAAVGADARVGPFARLRPGAVLDAEVHVGNFVEVKASRLGRGAKANHLSYIGDSEIGARANIGAGTITCNYDGVQQAPDDDRRGRLHRLEHRAGGAGRGRRRRHRRRRQRRHQRCPGRCADHRPRPAGRQARPRRRDPSRSSGGRNRCAASSASSPRRWSRRG